MHAFAKSLETQHLKWLRKCADQFRMVQDIALISARCHARKQQAECMVSKHIQALSRPHQISSFQFALCRRAFPDDRLLAWSEVKMSSHKLLYMPLTVWCVYPARECVVQAFQLANNRHFMIGIVSLSIFACQVMNPSAADFAVGGIRVHTFSTTTWNIQKRPETMTL